MKEFPSAPGEGAGSLIHPRTAQVPGLPDALTQSGSRQQNPSCKGAAAREVSWPPRSGSLRLFPVLGEGGSPL